ncbi:transcription initiation factor TFIID subunit 12-like [Mizuhopecten yessoensis]|nr:transcription initiation factor TFIID subunit 12-like [Mizuhopecten yessoensis]XP_021339105.1 transcription initiation factor TFIID subunit 12-like [Mizuhopecten yessoensis]
MNKTPQMSTDGTAMVAQPSPMMGIAQPPLGMRQPHPSPAPMAPHPAAGGENKVLDKRRLQELVKEVDPLEQLDDDVEEVLLQVADDFIDSIVNSACQIAKHRKSTTLEVKDVQLHLERNWNMWIPGFGSDELRPYKKACSTEAHKQRMALIRKTLKKY